MHVHEKKWMDKKIKKKEEKLHVHEQKWTDTKKRKDRCMSMNKSGRTSKKKKKIDDEVTLSHVGKSIP